MKVNDVYFADLSPSVGNEIGGVRQCKIVKIYDDNMVRVRPMGINYKTGAFVFLDKHERVISTKRLKEKVIKLHG